ncbi:putative phage tail protein [Brevibacillus dissolubilis]|uniref:putative phage tail protein n=1 Tax=Brevibacillus dissolubilis TaxID=1844116 RepID=UPI0021006329|nr:putative phage tail protein [Brevibacillus dissolubilis]
MLNHLPAFMQKSRVLQQFETAEQLELELINGQLEDLMPQLDVSTATWGLVVFEQELGIPTDLSKSYDARREVIRSKMRGSGKIDRMQIKVVADAYANGDCEVSFNGRIRVKFTSQIGIPPRLEELKRAIEEIKPAHLGVEYEFRYLFIEDVQQMTLEQLQTQPLENFAGGA